MASYTWEPHHASWYISVYSHTSYLIWNAIDKKLLNCQKIKAQKTKPNIQNSNQKQGPKLKTATKTRPKNQNSD